MKLFLGTCNNYTRTAWFDQAWRATSNRYDRIATGSPRTTVDPLTQDQVRRHINLLPTLHSVADFLHIYNHNGQYVGSRPKLATWPLTEKDAAKNKVWST